MDKLAEPHNWAWMGTTDLLNASVSNIQTQATKNLSSFSDANTYAANISPNTWLTHFPVWQTIDLRMLSATKLQFRVYIFKEASLHLSYEMSILFLENSFGQTMNSNLHV